MIKSAVRNLGGGFHDAARPVAGDDAPARPGARHASSERAA